MSPWLAALAVLLVLVLVFWAVGAYNRLAGMRAGQLAAFARIDPHWKHRYELIPHLVEAAKEPLRGDREALEAVIAARNRAVVENTAAVADPGNADALRALVLAENVLKVCMDRFEALLQAAAPAGDATRELVQDLTSTDHRIAFARQAYNETVAHYNTALQQFPGSIVANMFGFRPAEPIEARGIPPERRTGRPEL